LSEAKKIERQRQLDLLFLAGPKDFHPGEAQGASVASTMSVKLGVGVSQRRANINNRRACGACIQQGEKELRRKPWLFYVRGFCAAKSTFDHAENGLIS
jgi:hypothetical protein